MTHKEILKARDKEDLFEDFFSILELAVTGLFGIVIFALVFPMSGRNIALLITGILAGIAMIVFIGTMIFLFIEDVKSYIEEYH